MNDHIHGWLAGMAKAIAAAVILGGGASILTTKQEVAVLKAEQTVYSKQLDRIESKLDKVIDERHSHEPRNQ